MQDLPEMTYKDRSKTHVIKYFLREQCSGKTTRFRVLLKEILRTQIELIRETSKWVLE